MQKGEEVMTNFRNRYRFLARIVIETTTPLQIGSGNKSIKTDSLILRDVNGLPYIPGTTLAGLIRHELEEADREKLMGSQEEGSIITFTEARMIDNHGSVVDGLQDIESNRFLKAFRQLPIRQHVRISHRGAAEKGAKFDEEVIMKGTRFCFEIEMLGKEENNLKNFERLSAIIQTPTFRIGSGSRSGFGAVKVVEYKHLALDMTKETDLELYLRKSSSLAEEWDGWKKSEDMKANQDMNANWTKYELRITPEDFILFGSGFGDENADMKYVQERHVKWSSDDKAEEKLLIIPASSVKGALAHRTAFYYNQLTGVVIGSDGKLTNGLNVDDVTGKHNEAVKRIFGSEGEKVEGKMKDKIRGNILISDVIEEKGDATDKILNHVSIDRFTGGAIDGALFQEEVLYAKGHEICIDILVKNKAIEDKNVQKAFEHALTDIATGMLPLGGGVMRGNGCFTGTVTKYSKEKGTWKPEELA